MEQPVAPTDATSQSAPVKAPVLSRQENQQSDNTPYWQVMGTEARFAATLENKTVKRCKRIDSHYNVILKRFYVIIFTFLCGKVHVIL